jgi:hypothetical protein
MFTPGLQSTRRRSMLVRIGICKVRSKSRLT